MSTSPPATARSSASPLPVRTSKLMPGYSRSIELHHARHQHLGAGMRHAQADMAALQRAQRFHLRQRLLVVALRTPHRCEHDLAGRGELHAARQPVEQRRAHLLLEVEDLLVHRGGGQVQRLGRLAHRAAPRHRVQAAEGLGDGAHGMTVRNLLTGRKNQSAMPDGQGGLDLRLSNRNPPQGVPR